MTNNLVIVLAAGKGSRMKSDIPKPLHLLDKKTIIYTLVEKLYNSNLFEKILVVICENSHNIIKNLEKFKSKIIYIIQNEQLGTGHAVKCCKNYLRNYSLYKSLILFADCPLISNESIKLILNKEADCLVGICKKDNPYGNGRIILNSQNEVQDSIEEKDCTEEQKQIKLVNVGIFYIKNNLIINNIDKLNNNNSQKEYYLPELMLVLIKEGHRVIPVNIENINEVVNINTQDDLNLANKILKF